MSSYTNSRVVRGPAPSKQLTRRNYRKLALEPLRRDFDDRCAYSCQHSSRAGGLKCMEIDHFDPRKKDKYYQEYANFFLATRHCNGSKRDIWPSRSEQTQGLRYLNPCREQDYGVHIFEDPKTHLLVGVTPAGRYHIRMCDLNADHFVTERRDRSEIWELLHSAFTMKRNQVPQMDPELVGALRKQAEQMIPKFPHL
jgi:hypothetical protein